MTQDPIRYYVVVRAKGEGVKPEIFNADTYEARRKAASHLYFCCSTRRTPIRPSKSGRYPPMTFSSDRSGRAWRRHRKSSWRSMSQATTISPPATWSTTSSRRSKAKSKTFVGDSPDLPFAAADHWCIGEASEPFFADRSAAERLLNIDYTAPADPDGWARRQRRHCRSGARPSGLGQQLWRRMDSRKRDPEDPSRNRARCVVRTG